MVKLSYKLPVFEGPLDLLLHLIAKHKLNINDIPIAQLLDQYMQHIEAMQQADLDVASEFMEMAARLVYIKTASLLPRPEESEQLKRELTGQLLEYQAVQEAAAQLEERARRSGGFDLAVRPALELPIDQTYRRQHSPRVLWEHYLLAAGRGKRKVPPPAEAFSGIVSRKIVSVSSRVVFVLRRLWGGKRISMDDLIDASRSRSEMVATFLAILELIRSKRVAVEESGGDTVLKADGDGRWK